MPTYAQELETLITTVILPRYLALAAQANEPVPWHKIPEHLVRAANNKQHVCWLLKSNN